MIGSLMSRMGSADKLSIPQLQQAIKNGTLPAYIGIPLLQDKMREQKSNQAQQPQQPPIAQQVMQEAQGIDSAPSNLPTEMAHGGIVAFSGEENSYVNPNYTVASGKYDPTTDRQIGNMPSRFNLDDSTKINLMGDPLAKMLAAKLETDVPLNDSTLLGLNASHSFMPGHSKTNELGANIRHRLNKDTELAANYSQSPEGNNKRYGINLTKRFASGDLVEDDEDQNEEAEYQQALQMAMQPRLNETPRQNTVTQQPQHSKPEGIRQIGKQGKEFYEERYQSLLEKAKEMGFKHPEVIAKLGASQAAIETGFGKSAPNNNYYGIKGAGSQQTTQEYIPGKGMVTIKDSFRGYENPNASDSDYLRLMQNPRYRAVAESQDPYRAAQAVKEAGYATAPNYTEALSSILASMGKRGAEGGIMRLAAGGDVRHFAVGDLVDDEGNRAPSNYSPDEAKALIEKMKPTVLSGKEPISITGKSLSKPTPKAPVKTAEPVEKPAVKEAEAPIMPNQFDEFLNNYKQERDAIKQAREEDKYMALLSAGLGMMGGTSPYALSNIGKGAMAGVQELQESNKQRAAEKAALDRNYVTGQRYKQLGDIALMNSTQTDAQKQAALDEKIRANTAAIEERQQRTAIALAQLGVSKAQIDNLNAQRDTDRQKSYAQLYLDGQQKYANELEKAYPERRFIAKQQELYERDLKEKMKALEPIRELSGLPAPIDTSTNSDVINKANAILNKK
jgi:flagellum-specific peptidoglycan hydrolase FlgJ